MPIISVKIMKTIDERERCNTSCVVMWVTYVLGNYYDLYKYH